MLILLAGTAVLYLWNLSASGYANDFYAAAVQAGTQSWNAWLFGSLDSENAITVDKPPAALWVTTLSARIFGLSSWSLLVPQALMGVPAFGLVYLVAGAPRLRTRILQLLGAVVAMVVSAGWFVALVEIRPAAGRPYIGGSTNSLLELALGYNGLGRLLGGSGNGGGGGGGGGNTSFGGATGITRMFTGEIGYEISWLLPAALIALVAGLWLTRGARAPTRSAPGSSSGAAGWWSSAWCSATSAARCTPTTRSRWRRASPEPWRSAAVSCGGTAVMSLGGWSGSDSAVTLAQFRQ